MTLRSVTITAWKWKYSNIKTLQGLGGGSHQFGKIIEIITSFYKKFWCHFENDPTEATLV